MKLASTRTLDELRPVLKDENSSGPDPVYWVFSEVSEDWENLTVIAEGNFNGEFAKTFGHYHGADVGEVYHLIDGKGVLLLQKKHMEEGEWVKDQVDEVLLIKVDPGEEVTITPEWGHSWSNVGEGPLISFDNWREGHTPRDYQVIEKLHGMAYYLILENREVKAVPNPNYNNLPQLVWMSVSEFKDRFPG